MNRMETKAAMSNTEASMHILMSNLSVKAVEE